MALNGVDVIVLAGIGILMVIAIRIVIGFFR